MPQSWTQGRRTGLRAAVLLGRVGVCRATAKPQSGGLGTSMGTMTAEGLSQPVEGWGDGPTGRTGGEAPLTGPASPTPWPWPAGFITQPLAGGCLIRDQPGLRDRQSAATPQSGAHSLAWSPGMT